MAKNQDYKADLYADLRDFDQAVAYVRACAIEGALDIALRDVLAANRLPAPGLVSGALRKALERIEALSRWKFRGLAFVRLSEVLAALYLSSPIEPRCKVTGNPCGTDTWAVGYPCKCENCQAWLAVQASSEVREALEQIDGKHLCQTCGHRRGEHAMDLVGEHFCEHDGPGECTCDSYSGVRMPSYAELVSLLRALAPSRQGAAKRVEG